MAPTLNQNPQPGDLIEFFRIAYQHWAVYVGGGYVVHLTGASDGPGSSSNSFSSAPNKKALVKKEKLQDVAGTDDWTVNNILDKTSRPRPVDDIVKDACALVGKEMSYHVSKSNCEHFATKLRYGRPLSLQALLTFGAIGIVAASPLGWGGAAVMTVGVIAYRVLKWSGSLS
ncbi:phospholipase A and acyltransferase 3-like [Salarias fasciatus]|uniref:Phospholipase A and acyltransferase 3-like n=1 Tax=Salarias fasciatus TaxID=181472 RepID=A0A672J6K1_SALFA|nr:phospholipase A and acyltransferase 3-like [Salarias fasciatus]XP_029967942.1 phospholipase A and acyltransferase 3-like [Salarias fasciatus]XP_029967950.1 phospholipase A and acyltransferase 3-like [Salarias fasciatus]XP_029967958.1 phospholipase A and acyltransferase 3-like [Salarias fasciatus]